MAKILKWAGSKANQYSRISHHFDGAECYVEPFCGSAAFFFSANFTKAYLNDTNKKLMNFYLQLVENAETIWSLYNNLPVDEKNYYNFRAEFNVTDDPIWSAALFVYLNHYCFNGLYRTNSKGDFNTPFGARSKIRQKATIEDFRNVGKRLEGIYLSSLDFEDFLKGINLSGATVYMDPPYHTDDHRTFKQYGSEIFSLVDLKRLFDLSKDVSQSNKVIISYKDCSEFRELFGDYIVEEMLVNRNVGGFLGRRRTESELIVVMGS